jgi:hypothetical protein
MRVGVSISLRKHRLQRLIHAASIYAGLLVPYKKQGEKQGDSDQFFIKTGEKRALGAGQGKPRRADFWAWVHLMCRQ